MWAAMQNGMILFKLRCLLETLIFILPTNIYLWLRKPLFDCLFCMSSIWGFVFTLQVFSFSQKYLYLLLVIGGINYLLQLIINKLLNEGDIN